MCKIYANSLAYTEKKTYEVYNVMKQVPVVEDLGIIRNIGQPGLRIELVQNKMGVTTGIGFIAVWYLHSKRFNTYPGV
jgi:cobalt-zinc-cadmium resistance protein CzcA